MSILTVYVSQRVAAVAVDTEAVCQDGSINYTTKLFPLFHLNSVIAARGTCLFNMSLMSHVLLTTANEFDVMADRMIEILKCAFKAADQHASNAGIADPDAIVCIEVAFVGWSKRAQKMVGYAYMQKDRETGFNAQQIDYAWAAPWGDGFEIPRGGLCREVMIDVARQQVKLIERLSPGAAGGGDLIFAELGHKFLRIERLCELNRVR